MILIAKLNFRVGARETAAASRWSWRSCRTCCRDWSSRWEMVPTVSTGRRRPRRARHSDLQGFKVIQGHGRPAIITIIRFELLGTARGRGGLCRDSYLLKWHQRRCTFCNLAGFITQKTWCSHYAVVNAASTRSVSVHKIDSIELMQARFGSIIHCL